MSAAHRIAAAAGVIRAAIGRGQQAPGIATALESAGLLQSPESAAEQLTLLAEVDGLRARVAELEAAAAAVRGQHYEVDGSPDGDGYCIQCGSDFPCATRLALAVETPAEPAGEDEGMAPHPAPCRVLASPDCTCPDPAIVAIDRGIDAQFPMLAALRAEDAAKLARFEDARHILQQTREQTLPEPGSRLAMLLAYITANGGGEWTTKRVQHVYRDISAGAPFRTTARKDLHALAALGWLIHDTSDPGRHVYRLNHAKAATR